MDKQTLSRELQKFTGDTGVITRAELGRYLKMKPKNTERFLIGADFIPGRNRKFFIQDVAGNILAEKQTR